MKINKYFFKAGTLMFFNNFLCFFLILYSIYKKKWSPLVIAIFMGVLAYYFKPFENGDLYRYYQFFDNPIQREIIFRQQKDFFAKVLITFIIKSKIPRNFLAFFTCIFCYYFFLKSFYIIIKSKKISSQKYYFYLGFYFFSIPLTCYQGIRFYPAVSIFVFSVFLKFVFNKWYYIFFMLGSILIHISMVLPVFIFILYSLIKNKINIKIIKIMIFLSFVCGVIINDDIIRKLLMFLHNILYFIPLNYVEEYIGGKFGINNIKNLSNQGLIAYYILQNLKILILLTYTFFNKNKNEINKYIYLLIFFSLFFLKFRTIFERFFYWSIYLMILLSVAECKEKMRLYSNYLYFYITTIFLNFFVLIMLVRTQHNNIVSSYFNVFKISLINIIYEVIFK